VATRLELIGNDNHGVLLAARLGPHHIRLRGLQPPCAETAKVRPWQTAAQARSLQSAKRAIIAVAHAILIVIYRMLDLQRAGRTTSRWVDRAAIITLSVRRIEKLGS